MTDTVMRPEDYGNQYLDRPPARPEDHFPPDVPFGPRPNHVIPFDWAVWILTRMRDDEIAGRKPVRFSDWIKAASLEDF